MSQSSLRIVNVYEQTANLRETTAIYIRKHPVLIYLYTAPLKLSPLSCSTMQALALSFMLTAKG